MTKTKEDRMLSAAEKGFDLNKIVEDAKERYHWHREQMQQLEKLLSAVGPLERPAVKHVQSFKGWTIPQCAKQLILEAGHSLTSRQILNGMVERGWTTSSQRPITVVHSGLAESPYITRVGKRWDLSQKGMETEF